MKKLLFILAATATLFCACSKEASYEPQTDSSRLVRFTANIGEYSFKSIDAIDVNDQIGITAGAPMSKANVPVKAAAGNALEYVSNSNVLEWSASQIAQGTVNDFYAYAPYDAGRSATTFDFWAWENQDTEAGYKASDLMLAKATGIVPEADVTLSFAHALSKVTVSITSANIAISSVKIKGLSNKASVDIVTPAVTVDTDAANVKDIDLFFVGKEGSVYTYTGIVIPQGPVSPVIEVKTAGGLVYKFTISAAYTFLGGKNATAALTVNYNPGSVSANAVSFGAFTTTGWGDPVNTAYTDNGIQAQGGWSMIGQLLGDSWTIDFPMTENTAESQWEMKNITINPGEEFKFRYGNAWATNYGVDSADAITVGTGVDVSLVSGAEFNLKLADASQAYDIYLKPGTNKVWIQPAQ